MTISRPISREIASISFALIAGLLLLASIAIASTLVVGLIFRSYQEASNTERQANDVFDAYVATRFAVSKWRISSEDVYVEEFRDSIENLLAVAANLQAKSQDLPEDVVVLSNLGTELEDYQSGFEAMVAARAQYEASHGTFHDLGAATRDRLTTVTIGLNEDRDPESLFLVGRAQEALMLGRYYLQRFRYTRVQEDLVRSVAEMRAASDELQRLATRIRDPQRLQMVEQSLASVQEFIDGTTALSDAVGAEKAALRIVEDLGDSIVGRLEKVVAYENAQREALGPRGQAIAFWAVLAMCLASLVIVGTGWQMTRRKSRALSTAIGASVDCMARIADGDLDTEIRHAELENEIGRMARALEVFKANGKSAIALAEREKAAEQERQEAIIKARELQDAKETDAREQAEAARKAMIAELSDALGAVVAAASDGDFSRRVEVAFSDAELSKLAANVNVLVETVDTGIASTVQALSRVAQGDLTRLMEGDFRGKFKDLQNNTNAMVAALRELLGEIGGSTVNLAASSQELRDTSGALSKQAEQNAASLEQTSAALEQLTASIKQVSANVADANSNAQVASDTAQSSSLVAADAADAMARISDASREITKVVGVINDIAFQINLLALNAGVEAARAGDAGRGFSVVASEVRQLAQRAGDAAKEIGEVITRSDQAVTEGVAKVSDAKQSLQKIAESVVGVSGRIDEISRAISEQVTGVGEINTAVSLIDRNTQKQAASFEEVSAASSILSNEAEALKKSAFRFKTGGAMSTASARPVPADPAPSVVLAPVSGNLAVAPDNWEEF